MSKVINPFSAVSRKKIRDLEADLRGRGRGDETARGAEGVDSRMSTRLEALNPFSAFNRKQIRDLEAHLRGNVELESLPSVTRDA